MIVAVTALFLTACQESTAGFAGGECERAGHAKGSAAWKACVKAVYVREEALANRYGP